LVDPLAVEADGGHPRVELGGDVGGDVHRRVGGDQALGGEHGRALAGVVDADQQRLHFLGDAAEVLLLGGLQLLLTLVSLGLIDLDTLVHGVGALLEHVGRQAGLLALQGGGVALDGRAFGLQFGLNLGLELLHAGLEGLADGGGADGGFDGEDADAGDGRTGRRRDRGGGGRSLGMGGAGGHEDGGRRGEQFAGVHESS
jgi:hypothetical protein